MNIIKIENFGKRQLLFSCGDDGLIQVYDLNQIKAVGEQTESEPNRSTRGGQITIQKPKIHIGKFESGEFTTNGKQKQIDSLTIQKDQ